MVRRKYAVEIKINSSSSLSQAQKDRKIDKINNRPKLIPKGQREKIQVINWPNAHVEMEFAELVATRVSLMETLKSIKPENNIHKFIGVLNDADTACDDAWEAAVILRGLVAIVPEISPNEPGLPYLLERCAIHNMERAVERLTCILLNPNNLEMLGRVSNNGKLRSIFEKVKRYMKEARSWKSIGHMLIKGINEGNVQFVRGVLGALEARSVGGKSREEMVDPKSQLLSKEAFMQKMESRKGIDTAMEGLDQGAVPISLAIVKRVHSISSYHQNTTPHTTSKSKSDGKTQMDTFPDPPSDEMGPGDILESQPSKRPKYNRDMINNDHSVPDPTPIDSSNIPSMNLHPTVPCNSSNKLHEPREQETEPHEDSESTTDEDDPAEVQELFEMSKSMYNPDLRRESKPAIQPQTPETLSMKEFMMEIEAVKLAEDTTYADDTKTEPDGKQDGTNMATNNEMNDNCDQFQSAMRIYEDNSDEGIGCGDDVEDGVHAIPA